MIPGSANPLLLKSAAAAGGYQIERSLRFNSSDSGFCSRTPAVAGNRTTWTWAAWVKRTKLGGFSPLFSAGAASSADTLIYFDSGSVGAQDSINWFDRTNPTKTAVRVTTQVFRDVSAWYHFVFVWDSNNGTAGDRMKIYVNGIQITTFSSTTNPSPAATSALNNNVSHAIGSDSPSTGYFDGYLADIHFIDGQALTPSSFTEVSATTGQLIPKAYAGTYTGNSFWLKFNDNSAATATTLGKDSFLLGNNWTPNNFSVVGGVSAITTPASNAPPTVDYLVVAGGGGGGEGGGGGGAGGFRTANGFAVTGNTQYTVTVGAGGTGGNARGGTGGNSVFSTITSAGGGGGGRGIETTDFTGVDGGSGGGGGSNTTASTGSGGTGNTPSTSPSQGSNGGTGNHTPGSFGGGGGGGGASAVGTNAAAPSTAGIGGAGTASSLSNSSVTYAGGGGGGQSAGAGGAGGAGGGGAGAGGAGGAGTAGTANTGGGGGGGGANTGDGGVGGSGIVIVRYANTYADLTVGGGLTYTYANTGGYKIYSFTASATAAQSAGNDSLVDTPTSYGTDTGVGGVVRGNYATWNPLSKASVTTLSNGNLDASMTGSSYPHLGADSTIQIPVSGKWYWEITPTTVGELWLGVRNVVDGKQSTYYRDSTGGFNNIRIEASSSTGSSSVASYTNNDIIGVALNADSLTIAWYKNGSQVGSNFSLTTVQNLVPFVGHASSSGSAVCVVNFGQRAFAYTAPSGFKALCDTNLGAPLVAKSSDYFQTVLWTGSNTATARTISGLQFSPDLVWAKSRSLAYSHNFYDTVRGTGKGLYSDSTGAESTNNIYGYISAFNSDGFTGTPGSTDNGFFNQTNATYAAWCWDAGSSTVTNTQGSITSQVRANASAGFSVVTFNSGGSNGEFSVGHGLGVAPRLIIMKSRTRNGGPWWVHHLSATDTTTKYLQLSTTSQVLDNGGSGSIWGAALPTSTVFGFSVGAGRAHTQNEDIVSYCFAPVVGYSSAFSYTGNGSSDGPMVYLGFRPRFIIQKRTDSAGSWLLIDTARDPINVARNEMFANSSAAEFDNTSLLDVLSNGFKIRATFANMNSSGGSFIGFAWAENPFQYARAR